MFVELMDGLLEVFLYFFFVRWHCVLYYVYLYFPDEILHSRTVINRKKCYQTNANDKV